MIRGVLAIAALLLPILAATAMGPSSAESAPVRRKATPPLPALTRDEPLPGAYKDMVRRINQRGPADTLGDGLFALAEESFRNGAFDEASKRYAEFTQRFGRNLRLNDALERILIIRDGRDFDGGPLKLYARAEALRSAGQPDSAAALLAAALERYPGARIRWHLRYGLAEIARDKGNHASAIEHALAVADTAAHSRLAPYALKLAGDETLASGAPPQTALGYYQALLERFPDSPLAPSVRSQLLVMRKRLQL